MSVLRLDNVCKNLGGGANSPALLQDVSLEVDSGDSLAIVGRSGSGKSTLLSIIGLLDKPSAGAYWLNDRSVLHLADSVRAQIRGSTFGFIFQRFCLMNHLTVLENVSAAAAHMRLPRRQWRRSAKTALERVGLIDLAHRTPRQLSGGEQQRVAIARSLVGSPSILLADEPTGSLDQETGAFVMDELIRLASEEGTVLIVVTHDMIIADRLDRTMTLDKGRLV